MLIGKKGYPVSYECSKLIEELKLDIKDCGKDKLLAVWLKEYKEHGIEFAVNYDFIVDEKPITSEEIKENERVVIMSAESLLDILQKQNNPIEIFEIEKM